MTDYKQWYDAVTDACVVAGELPWNENDARGTVAKLIAWHVEVALDPRVSERAQALTRQAAPDPAGDVDKRVLDAVVHSVCHSDPLTSDGEYCLTVDELCSVVSAFAGPTNDLYAALRAMHWHDGKLAVIEAKALTLGVHTYSGAMLDQAIARYLSGDST